jgi:hypothetical protein
MALEQPFLVKDNIFVDEDKTLRFFVTTGEVIVIASAAADGATTITVDPLRESIAGSSKLRFGNMIVTVGGSGASIGDTSIAVSALTGTLPIHSVGRRCQNVTGWTTSWLLYTASGVTAATLTKSGAVITADEGVIDVAIADTDTATLTPREYWYKFRRTDDGSEQVLAFGAFHLRA